jgi:cell division septation protein DedD
MAGKRNGGGGGREMVLGSRHVVGLFLVIVVISGILFTLGYILGRNQYETQVRAASLPGKEAPREPMAPVAPPKSSSSKTADQSAGPPSGPPAASSDWDFYKSNPAKKTTDRLDKAAPSSVSSGVPPAGSKSPAAPASHKTPATPASSSNSEPAAPLVSSASKAGDPKTKSLLNAPLIPRGAITLQVAALMKENDALAIAEALQKKKFPAFVLTPTSDKYYRVQVGPYADPQSAKIALNGLEKEGFKAIVKH